MLTHLKDDDALTDPLESCLYIDSDSVLNENCAIWAQAEFLAIDTEFIRTDTFYPIAGLLQVGAAGRLYLIDPLKISTNLKGVNQIQTASGPNLQQTGNGVKRICANKFGINSQKLGLRPNCAIFI